MGAGQSVFLPREFEYWFPGQPMWMRDNPAGRTAARHQGRPCSRLQPQTGPRTDERTAAVPIVIITGGVGNPRSADRAVVEGAREALGNIRIRDRIVTFPDPSSSGSSTAPFRDTQEVTPRGRTRRARRFQMVSSADLVISIAGKTGSPESIMLAQALDIPALPLLFTGGASAGLTEAAREFGLDDETIRRWSAAGRAPEAELESYAQEVIDLVLARAVLPCFVAMPYGDETIEDIYTHAIEPGAALAGFRTVRSDQEVRPGQIPGQMLAAIADAAVVIAVLTDDRFPRLGADGLPVHEGARSEPQRHVRDRVRTCARSAHGPTCEGCDGPAVRRQGRPDDRVRSS